MSRRITLASVLCLLLWGSPVALSAQGMSTAPQAGLETTAKGTQASKGLGVQPLRDAGRTYVACRVLRIAGIAAEALASMTCNKGGTDQAAATTYTVTSGKTLRIQAFNFSIINTGVATVISGTARLRSAGACVVGSPVLSALEASTPSATATLQLSGQNVVSFPDGVEVASAQQICVSHLANSTNSTVTFVVVGFEY